MNKLGLSKHYDALIMALNSRMMHCQKELAEIAIQDDFIILEGQAFASEQLQKHFSISAYKAMKSAKAKLTGTATPKFLEFTTFNYIELTQLVKAVGALHSEHAELTNFLVDALIWNMCREFNKDTEI